MRVYFWEDKVRSACYILLEVEGSEPESEACSEDRSQSCRDSKVAKQYSLWPSHTMILFNLEYSMPFLPINPWNVHNMFPVEQVNFHGEYAWCTQICPYHKIPTRKLERVISSWVEVHGTIPEISQDPATVFAMLEAYSSTCWYCRTRAFACLIQTPPSWTHNYSLPQILSW